MSERTLIEDLTFRPVVQGGRDFPDDILNDRKYRPHIVIGDINHRQPIVADGNYHLENYLGIAFMNGPSHIEPGKSCLAQALLIYAPAKEYSAAVPGATFTLREGGRIVGHGRIKKRWTEIQ